MKGRIILYMGITAIPSVFAFTPLAIAGAGAGGIGVLVGIAYLIARRSTKSRKLSADTSRMDDHGRRSRHLSHAAAKAAQTAAVDPRQASSLATTLQAQITQFNQMAALFDRMYHEANNVLTRNPQLRSRYSRQLAFITEGRRKITDAQKIIRDAHTALSKREYNRCQSLTRQLQNSWLVSNWGKVESACRDIANAR